MAGDDTGALSRSAGALKGLAAGWLGEEERQAKAEEARVLRSMRSAPPAKNYVRYGDIFPDAPEALQNRPIAESQAFALAPQISQLPKLSAEESKTGSEAQEIFGLGKSAAEQWKKAGMGTGTLKEAVKGIGASLLPGQIAQRVVGPEFSKYQNTRAMLSEVALRAATGAATNPSEVKFYQGRLPEPGDTPEIAAGKINDFFGRVISRTEQTAKGYEARGLNKAAAKHRQNVIGQLMFLRDEMLKDFGSAPGSSQKSATSAVPAPAAPSGYDDEDRAAAQEVLANPDNYAPEDVEEARQILGQ